MTLLARVAGSMQIAGGERPARDIASIFGYAIGVAVADGGGKILTRYGPLSHWLPEPGGSMFEAPALCCMDARMLCAETAGGELFVLEHVHFAIESEPFAVTIAIGLKHDGNFEIATFDASRLVGEIRAQRQPFRSETTRREEMAYYAAQAARLRSIFDRLIRDDPDQSRSELVQQIWRYQNMIDDLTRRARANL